MVNIPSENGVVTLFQMDLEKKQRKIWGNRVLKRRNNLIKKADDFQFDFDFDVCLVLRKGTRTYVYANEKPSWPPIRPEVVSTIIHIERYL